MLRALLIALSGLAYFIISLPLMMPLRMWEKPVVNYNLFFGTFLLVMLGFLLYRCCTVEKESKAYVYGFFAGIFAWQLFGELASIPVDKGIITQFSDVNIKELGGYFYLAGGWIILKILWRTKAIKNSVAVFILTFLSIWTFELYMDNYSMSLAIDQMPTVATALGIAGLLISIILLVIARRASTDETKTVMGCLLYITLTIALLGMGQWKKPQTFYVKYEAKHIGQEIKELQEKQVRIELLKKEMIKMGMFEEEPETPETKTAEDSHE